MANDKKFVRQESARSDDLEDEVGRARVYVRLVGPNSKVVAGNTTRTITVREAKVSDVAVAIERALF